MRIHISYQYSGKFLAYLNENNICHSGIICLSLSVYAYYSVSLLR